MPVIALIATELYVAMAWVGVGGGLTGMTAAATAGLSTTIATLAVSAAVSFGASLVSSVLSSKPGHESSLTTSGLQISIYARSSSGVGEVPL